MHKPSTRANDLGVPLGLLLALVGATAEAGTAGRETGQSAIYLYRQAVVLSANVSYTIETLNLSPGGDTVLHVNLVPWAGGGYVAGNDDYTWELRSWVYIPATPADRSTYVIVRSYSPSSAGTGTLRITPSNGPPTETPISFSLGYKKNFGTYAAGTHFSTTAEQGGSIDTMLLITSEDTSRAITIDDDNGVGLMSWIHSNESCTYACSAIVMAYGNNTQGSTTFIWDEDIHYGDSDADGMSTALENAIGTNGSVPDSDGDGLKDGEETFGIDVPADNLNLPFYGANPLVKDLFIEADWRDCVPAHPADWTCGDPSNPDHDTWRLPADQALAAVSLYAPDVAVHIDIGGIPNTDPATRTKYGSWGAARKTAAQTGNKCDWLAVERNGLFHGARLQGWSGGQGTQPGACFDAGKNGRAVAHESGHNLNLSHGGQQAGGPDINCKPNYLSLMSYALTYYANAKFSRNEFATVPLNPVAVSEVTGLGTTDPLKINHLYSSAFQYAVDPNTGAVDWNRDGQIGTGLVRAAVTWGWGAGGCGVTGYMQDSGVSRDRNYTALTWSELQAGPRLYWFTRRESDGLIEYRYATSFPNTNWSPGKNVAATLLSSSLGGSGAPAAAALPAYYQFLHQLLLVYRDTADHLRLQRLYPEYDYWYPPEYVGSGSEVISGDPAAIQWQEGFSADEVRIYAVSGSRLKQWRIAEGWSVGAEDQVWSDGSPIIPALGIGVTAGYISSGGVTTKRIVAAIPLENPLGQVELAWKDEVTGTWTKLENSKWPLGKPVVQAQPGLAYVPFDRSVNLSDGRFYLAYNPTGGSAARLSQSEGNILNGTARRLQWTQGSTDYFGQWGIAKGNMTLLYDLAFDTNLRGAWTYAYTSGSTSYRELFFNPVADGIFDASLRDQNDYAVITANLRCAIGKEWPCPL